MHCAIIILKQDNCIDVDRMMIGVKYIMGNICVCYSNIKVYIIIFNDIIICQIIEHIYIL